MEPQAIVLEQRRRAPVGFDRSRGQRFVLRDAAGLLVRWMDQLGLARASVVGHSMGGFIAAYVAVHFPDRVERLVLVGAAALPLERLSLRHVWRVVRGLPHLPLNSYRCSARTPCGLGR